MDEMPSSHTVYLIHTVSSWCDEHDHAFNEFALVGTASCCPDSSLTLSSGVLPTLSVRMDDTGLVLFEYHQLDTLSP